MLENIIDFEEEDRCNYLFTTKKDSDVKNTFVVKAESAIRQIEAESGVKLNLKINRSLNQIRNKHGRYIFMRGFDDPDKAKNVQEIGRAWLEEANQFDYSDFSMIYKTTREIPGSKVILTFNPVSMSNWIYEKLYAPDAPWANMFVDIHSTCEDNPFLPEETKRFYRMLKKIDPNSYRVDYLGEFGVTKTGGEFYGDFDPNNHVISATYDPELPVHVSVDSNVLPYITVAFWQVDNKNKKIWQFHELPIKPPKNVASKAGKMVCEYLQELGYHMDVRMYGDASMRASNNIDENKRSFYDLFLEPIKERFNVVDCMPKSNPPVAETGEFVNALYRGWEGWTIGINESCTVSEADYIETKMASDGTVLKVRVKDKQTEATYEKNGHFSDTKRYILATALNDVYYSWKNRFSETPEYYIHDATPSAESVFGGQEFQGGIY